MPSHLHEILIEMFRERPELAAELLSGPLRVAVPVFQNAQVSSAEFTDVAPTEYRADAVITLDDGGPPVLAVIVEMQRRIDPRKRRSWPVYVATLHKRLDCPVALLVICPDRAVAKWCVAPIVIGPPGNVATPVVLGPDQVPVITDLDTARRYPELTVMSVMAHGDAPDPIPLFTALSTALDAIDLDRADLYTDLVLTVLSTAARDRLEEFMTATSQRRYYSELFRRHVREGQAVGEAIGEAKALLTVLEARGFEVPDDLRSRIADCTDLDQLDTWVRRAATIATIEDLDG